MKVASWNILAKPLADGEFMTCLGDTEITDWNKRFPKIVNCCKEILESCTVLATQENANFWSILSELKQANPNICGHYTLSKSFINQPDTTCEKLYINKLLQTIGNSYQIKLDKSEDINCQKTKIRDGYMQLVYNSENQNVVSFNSERSPEFYSLNRLLTLGFSKHDLEIMVKTNNIQQLPYISPDGLGLYWDSSKLQLTKIHNTDIVNSEFSFNNEKTSFMEFTLLNYYPETRFLIVNAHLKSGENSKSEQRRTSQLQYILDTINAIFQQDSGYGLLIPVILMDSNNNKEYEKTVDTNLQSTISSMLKCNNLVNIIGEEFKCVKMRHACGAQPNKYAQLMVDGIDKIIISKNYHNICFYNKLYLQHFTVIQKQYLEQLLCIRSSQSKRNFLTKLAIGNLMNNKSICDKLNLTYSEMEGSSGINSYTLHNYEPWTDNMKYNKENIVSKYDDKLQIQIMNELGISSQYLMTCLENIYPNINAPSDHPPVSINIHYSMLTRSVTRENHRRKMPRRNPGNR